MTRLYLATGDALVVIVRTGRGWEVETHLEGCPVQCVAVDPLHPGDVVCGTFGQGLWVSANAGSTWCPAGEGLLFPHVTAVAVSRAERAGRGGVIWAGTEPSAVFRSEDGGRTWRECPAFRHLPSASTWSFPPRPWTHHVRWIAPDPHHPGRCHVAVELGGVMRTDDGGRTWEDHPAGAYRDAHTLATHPRAPGRVYEAAGGGYAESRSGGVRWERHTDGLRDFYLWGLAVDPGDPDVVLVSAAPGPQEAHDPSRARSTVYRKDGGQRWQEVRTGLPPREGRRVLTLVTHEAEPGVIYAAAQEGALYRSGDAGLLWEPMVTVTGSWPWHDVRGAAAAA